MTYAFRVCFRLTGVGTLTSTQEFVEFMSSVDGRALKLSSGTRNVPIGDNDHYSVSGIAFETPEAAHQTAESVRHALLLHSARKRCGLDLGQNSLRGFGISAYGKELAAKELGAERVLEDHLGTTVYLLEPKPTFLRINMTGTVSRPVESLIADLTSTVGAVRFPTSKAETAAGIYALSHFVGRAPARFLLLFIALEALFEPEARSAQACEHVDSLVKVTKEANLAQEEKKSILSTLSFLRQGSIAATGRQLATAALGDQTYDNISPGDFFAKIYKVRNDLVHRGFIDAESLHLFVGEVDRFVADIVSSQAH